MRRYLTHLRTELRTNTADRESTIGPRMASLTLIFVPLVALYIVVAIVVVPPTEPRNFNFVSERGAITVLSGIFLAMACGFGFATFLLSLGSPRTVRRFWFVVSVALGLLAMDELLGFHEAIGHVLDEIDLMGVTSSTTIRRWNDLVVILYGVVALPLGVMYLPTMVRYPSFLKLTGFAFAFYVVHTAIDAVVEPPTLLSVILEESAKLFSGLFLALACLAACLVHANERTTVQH